VGNVRLGNGRSIGNGSSSHSYPVVGFCISGAGTAVLAVCICYCIAATENNFS